MESGILTRYSASAGSGKTYMLTAIYLARILRSPSGYRRILAVTFTHKAASDMKRKILTQLSLLSKGERSPMDEFLILNTGKSYEELSETAVVVLKNLLHDYTWFSVGTIDSFFQRVLKSFAREINLHQGYTIELEHEQILKEAVDTMLAGSSDDKELGRWLLAWSDSRLSEGKNWNLREEILDQSKEVFSEKFKLLPEEERQKLRNRDFLEEYIADLRKITILFRKNIKDYASGCFSILNECNVADEMFYYGRNGGVPSFLKKLSEQGQNIFEPPNSYILKVLDEPAVWTPKSGPSPNLQKAFALGFDKLFTEALKYYIANYRRVNSALLIIRNIYTLGILTDILKNVHDLTTEGNKFLLSDAGELLSRITGNDQSPFIYEKIGTTYENYMIDEFQDTSHIQWKNFRPLVSDSLASGFNSLVVGDLKQSIYRWRNSDWTIFGRLVEEQTGSNRIKKENLGINWRSKRRIVAFNNTLFNLAPALIDETGKYSFGNNSLSEIFRDSDQDCPVAIEEGRVDISFIDAENESAFRNSVLSKLPTLIESIQDLGYRGSDIGILVRKNSEGADILDTLLAYSEKSDPAGNGKYSWKVVSDESLLLTNSPVVGFVISVLSLSAGVTDDLNYSLILRNWTLLRRDPAAFNNLILSAPVSDTLEKVLPPGYSDFIGKISEMSLFNAVEAVTEFFSLGSVEGQAPYLSAFQDAVMEYSGSMSADIPGFLEWWQTTGIKKSVVLPDHRDSMKIMTIHKSKGLEFKIVIIPFINWGLGHSTPPLLWLAPGGEPMNKIHLVPVRYSSSLEWSDFADYYLEERFSAAVDSLNLLYVAFTRAVDGLFGFCNLNSGQSQISHWIRSSLTSNLASPAGKPTVKPSEYFNTESNTFSFGSLSLRTSSETDPESILKLNNYCVDEPGNRLKLRFHGEDWLTRLSESRTSKINFGRLMHEILESVYSPENIDKVVTSMVIAGKIPEQEGERISGFLHEAVSDERVKHWFSGKDDVISEIDILIPGGATKRPDRVIVGTDKTTVIDFKFGEEKKNHYNQVKEYMIILEKMGYRNVEGVIWYVDKGIILEA